MDLSVIIPVLNEQENVIPLAEELARSLATHSGGIDLLFVDDASQDQTWDRICEAHRRDPRVRGLRHQTTCGQSTAIWTGIQNSTAPLIATLDGDLQNDPADLPKMVAELSKADFVCGVRVRRQDNWRKRVSSAIARRARSWILGVDFRDTGCALRVFRRTAVIQVIKFNGWHRFMPILVHNAGGVVKELPVNHRQRTAGKSKYGIGNRAFVGLYDLIGLAWYQKRRLRPVALTEAAFAVGSIPGQAKTLQSNISSAIIER